MTRTYQHGRIHHFNFWGKVMKHAKQWLAAGLALGMTSLNASMPAQAEFFVQGVDVLDTDQNVIWMRDANLLNTLEGTTTGSYNTLIAAIISTNKGTVADTPDYFDGGSKKHTLTAADFKAGGFADYWGAIAFVKYLNFIRYGGSNKWTLPEVGRDASLGYSQTGDAYGALFYNELGGIATGPMPSGPFLNVQTAVDDSGDYSAYWFASTYAPNANYAWNFCSSNGFQWFSRKDFMMYVWPARPGKTEPALD